MLLYKSSAIKKVVKYNSAELIRTFSSHCVTVLNIFPPNHKKDKSFAYLQKQLNFFLLFSDCQF